MFSEIIRIKGYGSHGRVQQTQYCLQNAFWWIKLCAFKNKHQLVHVKSSGNNTMLHQQMMLYGGKKSYQGDPMAHTCWDQHPPSSWNRSRCCLRRPSRRGSRRRARRPSGGTWNLEAASPPPCSTCSWWRSWEPPSHRMEAMMGWDVLRLGGGLGVVWIGSPSQL